MRRAAYLLPLPLIFALGVAFLPANLLRADPDANPSAEAPSKPRLPLKIGNLILDNQDGAFDGLGGVDELTLSGEFKLAESGREGVLSVKAELAPGWHTFSVTQQVGTPGPMPSKLTVAKSDLFEVLGPFSADKEPKVKFEKEFSVPVEEHEGEVVWSAPIRLAEKADPETLVISIRYDGQVCEKSCIPKINVPISAKLARPKKPAKPAPSPSPGFVPSFQVPEANLTLEGSLDKSKVSPGGKVTLSITATPDAGWYVYAWEARDPSVATKPTLIVLKESDEWQAAFPVTSGPAKSKKTGFKKRPEVQYHTTPVTWNIELSVPAGAAVGSHEIAGYVAFQTCTDGVGEVQATCNLPSVAEFRAAVEVADKDSADKAPLLFGPPPTTTRDSKPAAVAYTDVASLAANRQASAPGTGVNLSTISVDDESTKLSLAYILPIALLGGFILNFMPCVLPVIGLKILSFVQQAGENRGRVFALNLWYSLGMLSVFMVLATLAVVWNLGWGEQNNNDVFNIVMISIVFTMGLSFLGVWEIPIPGFVGGGTASDLAQKEGPLGAILKGAITTLLATPCSGPGLATALAWCNGKPPHLVYLVFGCLGLGMALPYLVIGANPSLVKLLPRPGAWMETFKQMMGFVLFGTVVFMFSYLPATLFIPVLAMLFGLWAACWWIGRTPVTAELPQTLRAWAIGSAVAAGVGGFSFWWLAGETEHRLAWKPFSVEQLETLTSENKTVMVDFTADWCLTCKTLETSVLNTRRVKQAVERHQVETLVADWTTHDPKIGEVLHVLGSKQIPVLAIFPAGRPNEPIVIRGLYSKATLIKRLEEAAAAGKKESAITKVSFEQADLPWQPFSPELLESLKAKNKTVLVDFTADWSLTDKHLETTVLNTKEVQTAVIRYKVETLLADWTSHDPKVTTTLRNLGSDSTPTLAIFPAGRPDEPIVLQGRYTKDTVISSIEQAAGIGNKPAASGVAARK